ncbi:serpin family protein [Catellatospora coxensis]|uniref:Serine proteinase inhibitor n=1 Tax=Catellatospora coxensis TaxID=310354 RepID=A0A8J3KUG4_9ACTN|nr:serpin family protein [Catellatospora coxensis]GIG06403.1 serine proteinase inhibitor [Catellatospora coxensis]
MHADHPDTATATATRRALLLGLAAAAALPLVGCAGDDGPELVTAADVDRVAPPADAPVATSVDGVAAFGHRLMQAAAEPGANFVASPLSIALAFSMVRVGAGSTTAKELDAAFGFPAQGRDEAYNAISGQLATVDIPPKPKKGPRDPSAKRTPPVVSIGNALFPQQGFQVGEAFLRTLAEQYAAGVRPVDFGGDAADQINTWVDRQTAGRIAKVFDSLPATTKLVLANTVYFKADWHSYFLDVADAAFTKADGTVVRTPTMRNGLRIRYAETAGIAAIELPYAEGPYAMWLMLPPSGGKPEDALAHQVLARLRDSFTELQVDVAVPKWDFDFSIDLRTTLAKLGVSAAFDAGADFDGIAPGLFISAAVHKANITVDEYGTEAAAVTGLAMAMSGPPPTQATFVADRPFAFAVVGGKDRVPLFIGRVSDPSAKRSS